MFRLDPLTLATYSAVMGVVFSLLAAGYWQTRRTHPGFGHCAPRGPVRVTASIGLAASLGAETMVEELMRRADSALYLAKEGGRDRVVAG